MSQFLSTDVDPLQPFTVEIRFQDSRQSLFFIVNDKVRHRQPFLYGTVAIQDRQCR